jgi:Cu+-exporting ATPase
MNTPRWGAWFLGAALATTGAPATCHAAAAKPAARQARLATTTLRIEGMHCKGCAHFVKQGLEEVPGVKSAQIDSKTKLGVVRYNPATCSPAQLKAAVKKAGYSAVVTK